MLGRGRRAPWEETRQIPKKKGSQRKEWARRNNHGEGGRRTEREPIEERSHRPLPFDLARDGGHEAQRAPQGLDSQCVRALCLCGPSSTPGRNQQRAARLRTHAARQADA